MSETRSDMLVLPPDGISLDHYRVLYNWNRYARDADEIESRAGWGFLPGEVTVDDRVVRFWVLPNGKLDARNRLAVVGRYPRATPGGWVDWGFANRLERALEEKYGDDYPRPTVLSSTTAAIYIEDDPNGGYRYVREERTP